MSKSNTKLCAAAGFCFLISLSVCSIGQAGTIYWGLPSVYSSWGPGNFIAGSISNMTARAYGAYAFTDYASSWGLNNYATGGLLGAGASMNPWAQMYSLAPVSGYNSPVFSNPWLNYSTFSPSYSLSYPYTFASPMLTSFYSYPATYSYPAFDFSQWSPLSSPLPAISTPATTTATTTTATTTAL